MKLTALWVLLLAFQIAFESVLEGSSTVADPSVVAQTPLKKNRKKGFCNARLLSVFLLTTREENYKPKRAKDLDLKKICPSIQATCCFKETVSDLMPLFETRAQAFIKARNVFRTTHDILIGVLRSQRIHIFNMTIKTVGEQMKSCLGDGMEADLVHQDIQYLAENLDSAFAAGKRYLNTLEKNLKAMTCMLCDAPQTSEIGENDVFFEDNNFYLNSETYTELLNNYKDGLELKRFAFRMNRLNTYFNCLKPIMPFKRESPLEEKISVMDAQWELLRLKNITKLENSEDEKLLEDIFVSKEDLWKVGDLRKAIRIMTNFVKVIAHRFKFDQDIEEYMTGNYGNSYRMLYSRLAKDELFLHDIAVRHRKTGVNMIGLYRDANWAVLLKSAVVGLLVSLFLV